MQPKTRCGVKKKSKKKKKKIQFSLTEKTRLMIFSKTHDCLNNYHHAKEMPINYDTYETRMRTRNAIPPQGRKFNALLGGEGNSSSSPPPHA